MRGKTCGKFDWLAVLLDRHAEPVHSHLGADSSLNAGTRARQGVLRKVWRCSVWQAQYQGCQGPRRRDDGRDRLGTRSSHRRRDAAARDATTQCGMRDECLAARSALAHDRVGGTAALRGCQVISGSCKRALMEAAMGPHKSITRTRRCALDWLGQQTDAAIGIAVLNCRLAGRPNAVRSARCTT
jgi:hypothetical protein